MTRRAYYKKQIYYGEDFVKELEIFERNIAIDNKRFKDLKQKNKFSAVIRKWIINYNKQLEKELMTNLDTNK
jgi:hypothetical protein